MGSELLYLKKRASFHRRMARRAACGEARWAHQAFVQAYVDRIERLMGPTGATPARQAVIAGAPARVPGSDRLQPELLG